MHFNDLVPYCTPQHPLQSSKLFGLISGGPTLMYVIACGYVVADDKNDGIAFHTQIQIGSRKSTNICDCLSVVLKHCPGCTNRAARASPLTNSVFLGWKSSDYPANALKQRQNRGIADRIHSRFTTNGQSHELRPQSRERPPNGTSDRQLNMKPHSKALTSCERVLRLLDVTS